MSPVPGPPTRFRITESSLDTALRYETAIGLIADRYRPDLRILEVGAGSAGITEFLQHPVTGVDPAFERTAERRTPFLEPVVGTAAALPFADGSFDVVLSLEMLEHIPPHERPTCLAEMLRVLRPGGRMIVSFPSDATAARLDRWLNDAYRRKSGRDHPWASEHLEHGVPASAEVADTVHGLLAGDGTLTVRRHQSAASFRLVHGLYTARNLSKLTRPLGLHTRPVARALFAVARRLHGEPAYRTILVADRGQAPRRTNASSSSGGIRPAAASTPR
jgi:SAM-dependent methyltransferase